MKSRKFAAVGVSALAALFALSSCSVADQSSSNSGNSGSEASKSVTVITHESFALSDEVIASFEKKTGYKLVTTAPGDAGTVVNQILLTKDSPNVDAFFGIDNYSAKQLVDSGALAKVTMPKDVTTADPATDTLVPIDRGDVCMNVDNAWFKEKGLDLPSTFDDLLKADYRNLTVLTNPASSSPGFAMLAGTHALYGDGWKSYWEKLLANGAKVDDGWSTAYETDYTAGGGKGAYPIMLSYASSPADSEGATSSLDATCVRQIEYAGVLKGATNPEGAQAFVEFMLSPEVQADIPEQMYMYPEVEGVALPERFAKYAKLSSTPIAVDGAEAGAQREEWITQWTAMFEAVN